MIHSGSSGAAFLLMRKSTTSGTPLYSDMSQLKAHNIFPEHAPADVCAMDFPWVRVEDRSWANGRFKVQSGLLLTRVLQPRWFPRSPSGRLGQRHLSHSNVDGQCPHRGQFPRDPRMHRQRYRQRRYELGNCLRSRLQSGCSWSGSLQRHRCKGYARARSALAQRSGWHSPV